MKTPTTFKPIHWDSIEKLVKAVSSGKVTARELVTRSLDSIEKAKDFNTVITVLKQALDKADEIDKCIREGKELGRLAGIPFIAKDNFLTQGVLTTAGSNILANYIPPYSATSINKLEAEGAVLVAKANLDAFAHGSSTENSDFGPTLNPVDPSRVAGGSSGGSAAAVALGLVPFALGTDTGGSIRLPASFCGVVGLKPTYGLISRYGVVAMASSTDVIGPLTNSVEDAAWLLDILAGRDRRDSTTIKRENTYLKRRTSLKNLKVGVIKEYMDSGVDPSVQKLSLRAIDILKKAGANVESISLPLLDVALAVYYILVPAEISSNLSRYDGIRYGLSTPGATNLAEQYELTRSKGFNDENKRRIMIGTYVLSSGYYDAYYKKAQTVRTLLINSFSEAFAKFDVLVGPTSPGTAFKLGENQNDPLQMYLIDIMTVGANLVGIPAISIPVGLSKGLPVGFQLMANQKQDAKLLSIARELEELLK
jgi:aspartyl-tRNA(Asn)/glutamyl-tRNA(Gln) amidotransferase subunit A